MLHKVKLSSFPFAKNFSAGIKPLAQFIQYHSYGEDAPGTLGVRREQCLFYLRRLSALSAMPVLEG